MASSLDKFCSACGGPIACQKAAKLTCKNCNYENGVNNKFCVRCGTH
ncbi:MAG: zinc ribbon domain-containing protein [Candidatus Portnoybacteria bacterium]|nr:zinc ribbon domain-containing protein [Candidatus Portnoybacteria bacterium]